MAVRFTINKASNGQYYFEIQAAGNYETLATSETYLQEDKQDVLQAIELIRSGAASAQLIDNTD
jgi:uncharacterized protein YegP (UPF0339 family)